MAKVLVLVLFLAFAVSNILGLDICEDQFSGTRLLYPTDCKKYIVCGYGEILAIQDCEEGKHFNRLTGQCDEPIIAACDVEVIKSILVDSAECYSCRSACGCLSESDCKNPESPSPASPNPATPTPPTPAPSTPASPTPASPTPAPSTPASPTPGSPTPASPTPAPSTPAPLTPASPTPGSPTPGSPTPASPTPAPSTPASPTPGSPTPASPTPAPATPASPTPASPTPGLSTPAPSTPASPATPTPGSPTPGSPTPGSPTPGSPTPASPTPGSPTPASPTPASPTPASPTPGSPTPASPTPASPSPASPTPAPSSPSSPTPATPSPASPSPNPPSPSTNSTCSSNLKICVGQRDYTSVYVPDTCHEYAICISGCANIFSCPNNLAYDISTHSCTYPENIHCPYKYDKPTGPSAGPSGTKCENPGKCLGQSDGTLFPADDSSNGYIICQCECEIARPCPGGLVFNESLQVCDFPQEN